MDVLMDGLLLSATMFAGGYCFVLARRVNDLKSLDRGLGGSIVALTRQIEVARGTLEEARSGTDTARQDLSDLIARASSASAKLQRAVASAENALPPVWPAAPHPAKDAPAPAVPPRRSATAAKLVDTESKPPPKEVAPDTEEPSTLAEALARATTRTAPDARLEDLIPKPRKLPPLSSPLRPHRALEDEDATKGPEGEHALMEALSAIAGSGRA
mgnify:CR=1 FL=1